MKRLSAMLAVLWFCPAIPASGAPSRLPDPAAVAAGVTARLVLGSAMEVGLIAGAAAAQVCGTNNAPIEAARPIPADTAAPRSPVEPVDPSAPEPSPAVSPEASPPVRPDPAAAVLAAPTAGIRFFTWFAFDSSELEIHPTELVIDMPVLSGLSDELNEDSDDVVEVDDRGEESCCSAVGTAEVTCDSTAWVFVLAEVPVAWATAAPCPASPAGLVVGCGGVNGDKVDAAAEEPA